MSMSISLPRPKSLLPPEYQPADEPLQSSDSCHGTQQCRHKNTSDRVLPPMECWIGHFLLARLFYGYWSSYQSCHQWSIPKLDSCALCTKRRRRKGVIDVLWKIESWKLCLV
jgi:hypothetical protein